MSEDLYKKKVRDERYYGVGRFILEIIKIVALAFVIIVPIRVFLFQPFFVQGASMEPNFEDSQYLIINELGYKETSIGLGNSTLFTVRPFKKIERGKVVVFRPPVDPSKYFIKRTVGLPGERVEIKDGKVYIYNSQNPNGFQLNEREYLSSSIQTNGDQTVTLRNNEFFVMGDNRLHSSDSRAWGPVKDGSIVGEVLLRAWPLDKIAAY